MENSPRNIRGINGYLLQCTISDNFVGVGVVMARQRVTYMLQRAELYHCLIRESFWQDTCTSHTGTPRDDWVFAPVTTK